MIEVDFSDVGHLLGRALFIEAVQWNERALIVVPDSDAFKNLLGDSRFTRGSAACNSHENGLAQLGLSVLASDVETRATKEGFGSEVIQFKSLTCFHFDLLSLVCGGLESL